MRSCQLRQLSICQFSTCSWSFSEDLARFKTYGYQSVGIWRRKLEDFGIERAIDHLFESKLNVTSLHWAGGFTGEELSLAAAIQETHDAIRLAARINADCLLVHPGSFNGHIFKHINGVVRDSLAKIIPVAQDYGVQLVIEPILDQKNSPWTIYETLDRTLDLLDAFPSLGINLDLYHVGLSDAAFDRLEEYVDRIKLVQLADRMYESLERGQKSSNRRFSYRLPLGHGDIQLEDWITRLSQLGYRGAYELEVHGVAMLDRGHFGLVDETSDFFKSPVIRQALLPSKPKPAKPKRVVGKKNASRAINGL